ncbi:MAG TPA: glycosyltransferase family 87 protein [Rhizomicrobium sp.]|jgi:hypothetical protein|nr:glycosyltransferase family 87 protein [Rhizomicrobium sp.]
MTTDRHIIAKHPAFMPSSGSAWLIALASTVGVAYAVTFAWMCATHVWLFDASGRPPAMDFAEFWSAGSLALHGKALAAYDPRLIHAAEVAVVGHPFPSFIGWFYPPLFFLVAAAFALLSPSTAFVAWTSSTLILQAGTVAAIVRRWPAFFLAMAPPWVMICNVIGQDGLLTAALIGAVLLALPKHQIVGGILLGFLAYKPQFGLLFPLVLVFGGYWRGFGSAAISVTALMLFSAAVFGFATLPAFFHGIADATSTHLMTNKLGMWFALQSVYGVLRCLGASASLAMTLHLCLSALCAIGIALLWWSKKVSYGVKAAAVCVATLFVTPYIWINDIPVLSIAIAFLYCERPLARSEWYVVLGSMALVASYPFVRTVPALGGSYPVGLIAAAFIALLVLRRLHKAKSSYAHARQENMHSSICAPAQL